MLGSSTRAKGAMTPEPKACIIPSLLVESVEGQSYFQERTFEQHVAYGQAWPENDEAVCWRLPSAYFVLSTRADEYRGETASSKTEACAEEYNQSLCCQLKLLSRRCRIICTPR